MAITVESVYENGVLKLSQPLPFQEHEKVQVTVCSPDSLLLKAYGILGWTGSAADADRFAMDPELAFPRPKEGP